LAGARCLHKVRLSDRWRKTWSLVVPVQIDDTPQKEILFYDGLDGYGRFSRTDGAGSLTTIRDHSGWGRRWRLIVAGDFITSRAGEELLFYNYVTGSIFVYGTNSNGTISLLRENTGFGSDLSIMVPGEFSASSGGQEVLLYNPVADYITFLRFSSAGVATEFGRSDNFGTFYTQIVAGTFPLGADLAFYQPSPVDHYPEGPGLPITSMGSISFYAVTEGALQLTRRDFGERRTWGQMISGKFTTFGPGMTVLPKTSLIFYDRFRQ
jgi:hypothetical protein